MRTRGGATKKGEEEEKGVKKDRLSREHRLSYSCLKEANHGTGLIGWKNSSKFRKWPTKKNCTWPSLASRSTQGIGFGF